MSIYHVFYNAPKHRGLESSVAEHEIFYRRLSDCLGKIINQEFRAIVVSDFNVDLSVVNIKVHRLICMIASHDLKNKILSFTRDFKNRRL